MSYEREYRQKRISAEEAAALVQDGDWIDYGWCATTSVAFDKALAARLPNLKDIKLRGGILMHTPAVFTVPNAEKHLTWNSWHMGGIERKAAAAGLAYYTPLKYSELPRYYRESNAPLAIAVFQAAPPDEKGCFNFGPSASHLREVCRQAHTVIVEVNKNVPYCCGVEGECGVHIRDVDGIIETDNPPLDTMGTAAAPTPEDMAVAKLVVNEIPDGACLQLGIGSMPNTIGKLIAESDLKDLGVHTEMYVDAFVDMAAAGKISGKYKESHPGKQVYAFAAGTQKLYDYLHQNTTCLTASVEYVNQYPTIAGLDRFVSINNAVDIDLFGQVNAESAGTKNISGAGGQLDFVLGAYASRGGKSFICLSSTFHNKKTGQRESRIRPTLADGSIVTDTRANVQYVVTEFGMVNLKGLSTWERAEKLIALAHPDFRDELIRAAEKMHIWRKSNRR